METRLLGAEEAGAVLPLVKDKIEDTLYQRIVEDYRQQILVIFGIFDEQRVCGISALKERRTGAFGLRDGKLPSPGCWKYASLEYVPILRSRVSGSCYKCIVAI